MDCAFRNKVAISFTIDVFLPTNSEFHLAIDDDTPLRAVGVWSDFADRSNVHENELMIFGLRQPAFHALKGDVGLRQ